MTGVAPLATFEDWWGGREVFHQTPLYPYLLAISMWLSGGQALLLLLQVGLSSLAVYLMYRLGRRLADERSGLISAALAATYAPWIFYDTMVLRASLGVSLTLISVWLLIRLRDSGGVGLALGTGAVLAAGFLMRPAGLALLLLGPAVLFTDTQARGSWKRWLAPLVVGAVLAVAPFVARNAIVGAPLLSFSTRGPETVAHANHRGADPGFFSPPADATYRQIMEEGHGSLGAALLASIHTWPEDGRVRGWLGLEARKLHAALRDYEYVDNANFYFFRQETPGLKLLPTFGAIVGLALVGVVLLLRRGRDRTLALLLLLSAAAAVGTILLAFASGRYRLPLAVLGMIPAGVTLSALVDWARERRWRPFTACSAAVVLISAVSYATVPRRVLYDLSGEAHVLTPTDSRLLEQLAALRTPEFLEEVRDRSERGEADSARAFFLDYLADVRGTIVDTPTPESRNVRRTIINQTYVALEWARDELAEEGMDDLAQAVEQELAWIRENT
jgi:4-amino-4-deoxy-L-arabinose transferase-like glycosyltransferase